MKHVIIRTRSAGVFFGLLEEYAEKVQTATLRDARRLWYWAGAASLSELAVKGVKRPKNCKFPISVPSIVLPEVIELIPVSDAAKASIDAVPNWEA